MENIHQFVVKNHIGYVKKPSKCVLRVIIYLKINIVSIYGTLFETIKLKILNED